MEFSLPGVSVDHDEADDQKLLDRFSQHDHITNNHSQHGYNRWYRQKIDRFSQIPLGSVGIKQSSGNRAEDNFIDHRLTGESILAMDQPVYKIDTNQEINRPRSIKVIKPYKQVRFIEKSIRGTDSQPKISSDPYTVDSDARVSISRKIDNAQKRRMTKIQRAIFNFCENVSVAGLADIYKVIFIPEKIMWYTVFVLAIIGMIYSSYGIAMRFFHQSVIYDDMEIMQEQFPFPDVSVCAPEAVEKMKMREKIIVPEKVKKLIKNNLVNEQDIIDYVIEFSSTNTLKTAPVNASGAYAMRKILDATFDALPGGYIDYLKILYPLCEKSLSDCFFDGEPFDCCNFSSFVPFDNAVCYRMAVQPSATHKFVRHRADSSNGLLVNMSIDRRIVTYTEGVANDGFHIHIGPTVSVMSVPIGIPSGMDAKIILAPPIKLIERSNCYPNDNPPPLRFFDHYDQYGTNCFANFVIDIFSKVLSCAIPYLTLDTKNMTPCGASAMGLFGAFLQIDNVEMKGNNVQSKLYTSTSDARKFCKPLCSRWIYPVISASYGRLQFNSQNNQSQDRTWSRVSILFETSAYRLHKEEPLNRPYILVCTIGITLGGYAGISMVTFAEIMAYGFLIIWVLPAVVKMRKRMCDLRIG